MQVAQTIINQIKAQDKMALWAWGANEYIALPEDDDSFGGLQFKIKTPKYKRGVKVRITLNGSDLYDIEVIRVSGAKVKVLDTANDVYADMLIEVLDELIEGDQKGEIFF